MIVAMMAAASRNGAIGKKNAAGKDGLPWGRLPKDLKRFREFTTGKPVIMGRTTFVSIDEKPLPKRTNIVISSSMAPRDGVVVVRSLDDAYRACGDVAEAVVVGGARVYADALARADRVVLTVVDADLDGDAFFPALDDDWVSDPRAFELITRDEQHAFDMRFYDLWRRRSAPAGCAPFTWPR